MTFRADWIRAQFQLGLPEIDVDLATAREVRATMRCRPASLVLEDGTHVYANPWIPAGIAFFYEQLVAVNEDVLAAHGTGEFASYLQQGVEPSTAVWRHYDLESVRMLDELADLENTD